MTLHESDAKYRDLVERANDGIVLIQDARIVYINPRMAEIIGTTVDETLDTAFIEYIETSERPAVLRFYRQRMEGRDVKQKYETKLRHKQGYAVDVEINAGLIPFQGRTADLALVRDISERKQIEMEIEKAMKQGIRLDTNLSHIPDLITADERKVKQILYNLLSNAVKFTPAGGHIILSAIPSNSGDSVEGHQGGAGRKIEISVADSGIGLDREDLYRVFNPFEQVEVSASRKYQGTGLGLSLTKKLVELHHGTIWAESEGLGRGSRFCFTLPIAADDLEA